MSRGWITIALLLAGLWSAVGAEPAAPGPARDRVDVAISRALTFLRRSQTAQGCWRTSTGSYGGVNNTGITGLCVMAFLSAGQTPAEGEHARAVADGVRWVLSRQKPNGLISASGDVEMYEHGICTLMLAEVIGMCPPDLSDEVRPALAKAVKVILSAQRTDGIHSGGWRYHVYSGDADLSVTGWQLLALRAAKNVGCDVPASAIERAVAYVRRSFDENYGTFRYQVHSYRTVPCAGTGILALELCGKDLHRCRESLRAAAYILRSPPAFEQQHCFYGLYYCSQAMFQLGDNYWTAYRGRLHSLLLGNQQDDGSWAGSRSEAGVGVNYTTAMAVLALTVEYRFLPIYQRGEEPTDAGKDK